MKLFITRDQAKGLLGGTKFELTARVELGSEESGLVSKYKADKAALELYTAEKVIDTMQIVT